MFLPEGGVQAVERLLAGAQRFTAIFAANDQMAYGAALALHRRGLRVPADVSLVGFDDLPVSAYLNPPLSTVEHPAYEMGRQAAAALLQLLRGEKPMVQVPPPRIIVRESSRAPAP
jgi:LacI family transcriptional regulator